MLYSPVFFGLGLDQRSFISSYYYFIPPVQFLAFQLEGMNADGKIGKQASVDFSQPSII
ncbi:hypothetical protein ES708_32719 [subsurface metagenome]